MSEDQAGILAEEVTDELSFDMDQEQMASKGKLAAKLKRELDEIQLEYKDVQQRYREQIKKKNNHLGQTLDELDTGCERRSVSCIIVRDYNKREKRWLVDNKVQKTEPMTEEDMARADDDLQGDLGLDLSPQEDNEDLSSATVE